VGADGDANRGSFAPWSCAMDERYREGRRVIVIAPAAMIWGELKGGESSHWAGGPRLRDPSGRIGLARPGHDHGRTPRTFAHRRGLSAQSRWSLRTDRLEGGRAARESAGSPPGVVCGAERSGAILDHPHRRHHAGLGSRTGSGDPCTAERTLTTDTVSLDVDAGLMRVVRCHQSGSAG